MSISTRYIGISNILTHHQCELRLIMLQSAFVIDAPLCRIQLLLMPVSLITGATVALHSADHHNDAPSMHATVTWIRFIGYLVFCGICRLPSQSTGKRYIYIPSVAKRATAAPPEFSFLAWSLHGERWKCRSDWLVELTDQWGTVASVPQTAAHSPKYQTPPWMTVIAF